ncbi:MAG TPA: ABC transporter [Lachnoclostridium sp.]|jgi:ABC-2 type transport system permease protein|uniref:ABC transporter permease subunit n=1 Tax=Lacrimispora sp. TaxID=2719234 RepID=UPI000EC74452|nr:ABC transporter permease subunit [Lacrimispora sp.]HCD43381.1 ABC transporter [Lachnoclostridium sp.]
MAAIYRRELKAYFQSMTGYVFIAFMVLFIGIYFMAYNMMSGYPYFSYTLSGMVTIIMIGIPVLTMRSFADDRKTKTDQLLLTSPVSVTQMVLGKYLSMITVYAVPVLLSGICPLIIKLNGNANLKADYASILAFFLLGGVYIAVGMFISSLTESQIIAAVGTFGIILLLLLWPSLVGFLPTSAIGSAAGFLILWTGIVFAVYRVTSHGPLAAFLETAGVLCIAVLYLVKRGLFDRALTNVLEKIAVTDVFQNFASHDIFDAGGLVYYISIIFLLIFLTVQSIEKRRWS